MNLCARGSLCILSVKPCARARKRECGVAGVWGCTLGGPERFFGDKVAGLAGGAAFPSKGRVDKSLRLWSAFNASPFQGSTRSSCFWRHPGANSAG